MAFRKPFLVRASEGWLPLIKLIEIQPLLKHSSMANLDAAFYIDQQIDDPFSRYQLKRQPSSDSLRKQLEIIADSTRHRRGARRSKTIHKPSSPRLIRISRRLAQSKPSYVKAEEDEVKKINGERLYWFRQQENAERKCLASSLPSSNDDHHPTRGQTCSRLGELPPARKPLGIKQINSIRDQIQIIKQDLHHRYPDLPSPKSDSWFRLEEFEPESSPSNSTRGHHLTSKIPHKSRELVEKGVVSLQKKIQTIKVKSSRSSLADAARSPSLDKLRQSSLVPTEPVSRTTSSTSSSTHLTGSIGTPESNQSKTSLSSHHVSPNSPSQNPSPSLSHDKSLKGARYLATGKGVWSVLPGSIIENDETQDCESDKSKVFFATESAANPQVVSSSPPMESPTPSISLLVATQNLHEVGSSSCPPLPTSQDSNSSRLQPDASATFSPTFCLSPQNWPESTTIEPEDHPWFCSDNQQANQMDRMLSFSNELSKSSVFSVPDRLNVSSAHRDVELPLHRSSTGMSSFESPRAQFPEPMFDLLSHGASATQRESLQFWCSNLGHMAMDDFQYFVPEDNPRDLLLVTDVLVEQQGGLSFLGQEKFNERFRSKPWQTMKNIRQYNRPGHPDAEYLPNSDRVELVQTPHTTQTFPLPTPEWYWVTDFSIDRDSRPVDDNGWEYYDVFSRKWSPHRHGCRTFIRRRRWTRVRAKLNSTTTTNSATNNHTFCNPFRSPVMNTPFHSEPLNGQKATPIVVVLRKIGFQQSITFNPLDGKGGRSLTINLPALPSLEIHWDDSSLTPQSPLFSSQMVASEIVLRLGLVSKEGLGAQDNLQDLMEMLMDRLAKINLQRLSKTLTGLAESQKIKLWRYWLGLGTSLLEPTVMAEKPDPNDLWRIIDRHFEEVLEMFVLDAYRVKFVRIVVGVYSQFTISVAPEQKQPMKKTRSKSAQPGDLSPPVSPQLRQSRSNEIMETPRIPVNTPAFLKSIARPSFLDFNQIQLEFWNNVVQISVDLKIPEDTSGYEQFVLLKRSVALDIRRTLHKHIKAQNKIKRIVTISK